MRIFSKQVHTPEVFFFLAWVQFPNLCRTCSDGRKLTWRSDLQPAIISKSVPDHTDPLIRDPSWPMIKSGLRAAPKQWRKKLMAEETVEGAGGNKWWSIKLLRRSAVISADCVHLFFPCQDQLHAHTPPSHLQSFVHQIKKDWWLGSKVVSDI